MIEKFTFENEGQVYQCKHEVIGKRDLRQIIHVSGIGSKKGSAVYGASKHSAATMMAKANELL
jgi:hypothetical protein